MNGTLALGLWDIEIEVLRSTNDTVKNQAMIASGKPVQDRTPKPKHQLTKESKRLINCQMWINYPLTHTLLKVSLSCTF